MSAGELMAQRAHDYVRAGDYRMGYLAMCEAYGKLAAALQDVADAEAIPNDAVAFVWCREVARAALAQASSDAAEKGL